MHRSLAYLEREQRRRRGRRSCAVPRCANAVEDRCTGLCGKHYVLWRQTYDSEKPLDESKLRWMAQYRHGQRKDAFR